MERFFKQLTVILAIAFLAILVLFASFSGRDKKEIARLEQNCLALTDSVKTYRVSDSLNAVQVKALRLTASEYKELYASEQELVKSKRARARRSTDYVDKGKGISQPYKLDTARENAAKLNH